MNAQLRRRLEMAARARDFLRAHQLDGVGQGLGLAKLEELLERAENLATQQRAGRREHVGARAELKSVAADISLQLRLLDKVVRYRFGDNAELMGAWESARNVAGSFQTKNEPESGAGGSDAPKAA